MQHTMVPYLWRRHLAVSRAIISSGCLALYLAAPVPPTTAITLVVGAFVFYSLFVLVRDTIETSVYPLHVLTLDLMMFFICALHPSDQGYWLSMLAYFYVLMLGALMYTWRNVISVVAACVGFFAIVRPPVTFSLWPTVVLAGTLAILLTIQKQHFQQRLSAALKRSVLARTEAETARESERQRIAADFHDGPLQSFISFQMRLEIIRKLMARDQEAALKELQQLQELGKSQVTELRSFVRNMQPVEMHAAGLQASLRELIGNFERDSGIEAALDCSELQDPARQELATEVLQIVREALNNVRKHSKASRVTVTAATVEDSIALLIDDDGSGYPFSGSFSLDELELLRLGPRSIKRRVRTLGGELQLESRPSLGAGLKIRIPA